MSDCQLNGFDGGRINECVFPKSVEDFN